jgi:hypothetical protein
MTTKKKKIQILAAGDRVKIKSPIPFRKYHPQGCEGVLKYHSKYNPFEWAILVDGHGSVAWYPVEALEAVSQAYVIIDADQFSQIVKTGDILRKLAKEYPVSRYPTYSKQFDDDILKKSREYFLDNPTALNISEG